jgi:hypothetical protein
MLTNNNFFYFPILFSDLSNATFVPVGPPHGDHPSYGSDFSGPPFDGSGRGIYPGDSYRTSDSDMYNPAPSPDFASTVIMFLFVCFPTVEHY